ncbi:MAG: hypothetical protein OSA78_06790 [Flavobacteriales bacterium]|nr:hypothetical protein [Flavobacteriales bacterium]
MRKFILTLIVAFAFHGMQAQVVQLEGPRFGVSFISDGSTAQMLQRKFDMDSAAFAMDPNGSSITTQYGWQWEKRFADNGGDVVGLVEWVVMVAGMEKGMFLPSLTTMVGVRGKSGFEFGTGPNLSLAGLGFVFAVGYNVRSGDLNFPVNLSIVPDKITKGTSDAAFDLFNFDDDFKSFDGEVPDNVLDKGTGHRITLSVGFNFN